MFESEFIKSNVWNLEQKHVHSFPSDLLPANVRKTQLLHWREHCLECSPPACYHSCRHYIPRIDKRCLRLNYGIYQNNSFHGLFTFGADLRFQPWAKLGTNLYDIGINPKLHNVLSKVDFLTSKAVTTIFRFTYYLNPLNWCKITLSNPQRISYKTYAFLREKSIRLLSSFCRDVKFDYFVLECYSFEKDPFRLLLEYSDSIIRFRHVYEVVPGHNFHKIPIDKFNGLSNPLTGSINLYPENNRETRIVFTWLDFIQINNTDQTSTNNKTPAEKVKCVAWDLDNTLWKGILIEDGKEDLIINQEAIQTIKKLDERGIIQTIVSKNNYEDVWVILNENGIQDYFLYPAINWAPKSSNLKQIAEKLNINIDTFSLIDDSAFERAEVSETLPQVRVYSEKEITFILDYPEFNVPITQTSRNRRKSYLAQIQRERIMEGFSDDYESFLKSCRMELRIFTPSTLEHVNRCLELIQRSNQLNLSTKRYTPSEFQKLLATETMFCVALHCTDRFGDYGIVGFASIDESQCNPKLIDLVISCRVAQKKVEQTFLEWLVSWERKKGTTALKANIIKTNRNSPLIRVFESLPFNIIDENEQIIAMELPFNKLTTQSNYMKTIIEIVN